MNLSPISSRSSEETLVPVRISDERVAPARLTNSEIATVQESLTWAAKWAIQSERRHQSRTSPFLALEPQAEIIKFSQSLRSVVDQGIPLEHALSVPVTLSGETIPQVIVNTESFRHMLEVQALAKFKTIELESFKLGPDFLTVYDQEAPRGLSNPELKSEYLSGEMIDGIADGWCKHHLTRDWFHKGQFVEGQPYGFGERHLSTNFGRTTAQIERGFWGPGDEHDVQLFRCLNASFFSRAVDQVSSFLTSLRPGGRLTE